MTRPLIGVSACLRQLDEHAFHVAGDKYVRAVCDGADGVPLLIPALGDWYDMADLARRLDGLLLTGSPSNVAPHRYGGGDSQTPDDHDHERDATVLPLVRAALEDGLPLLAICRGFQELNVALGGTLHQKLHETPARRDHRGARDVSVETRYRPVHPLRLASGGLLAGLLRRPEIMVNSLHGQGIERLAPGLAAEAVSEDGVIEAATVRGARAFALGVQWHPEWRCTENEVSTALLAAFGDACRARARSGAGAGRRVA